jgi:hypothetical protein
MIRNVLPKRWHVLYEADELEYTLTKSYKPDFTIEKKSGTMYIEAKGLGRAFDAAARTKMAAVRKQHPEKDIRIVFMTDRPFRKGGKMRPSDWAKKHGYPFAIGEVPQEWFEE